MAADNKNDTPSVNIADLVAAFSGVISAAQPVKDVDFAEYISRPGKLEPVLDRPVFQNGLPIQIKGCSQDTINHLNNLQPGRYIDNRITVELKGEAPFQEVHITYPCATNDQRLEIYTRVSSFSDMVQKIAREANAAKK